MFIDFAGCMINTNYIISIYKTKGLNFKNNCDYFDVNIKLYPNDIPIKEIYNTKQEQEIRFNEIISMINKNNI